MKVFYLYCITFYPQLQKLPQTTRKHLHLLAIKVHRPSDWSLDFKSPLECDSGPVSLLVALAQDIIHNRELSDHLSQASLLTWSSRCLSWRAGAGGRTCTGPCRISDCSVGSSGTGLLPLALLLLLLLLPVRAPPRGGKCDILSSLGRLRWRWWWWEGGCWAACSTHCLSPCWPAQDVHK